MPELIADPVFWLYAVPAIILFGLSKGGLSGLGALATPLLALAIPPVKAAAILLPILIAQDWVGVWSFRRDFDRRNLAILIPSSLIGVAIATLLAARVSENGVRGVVGLVSLGFVAFMLIRDRLPQRATAKPGVGPGIFWGAMSGFTSFISHAGGPPFLVYVMPQKLDPKVFAGTSVIFFAIVNLLKVPPYLALGVFTVENLTASAILLPLAIASAYFGIRIVQKLPADRFYGLILLLSFALGVKLIYDALH